MKLNKLLFGFTCGLCLVGCAQTDPYKVSKETMADSQNTSYKIMPDGTVLDNQYDSRKVDIFDEDTPMGVQPDTTKNNKIKFNPLKIKKSFDKHLPEVSKQLSGNKTRMEAVSSSNVVSFIADPNGLVFDIHPKGSALNDLVFYGEVIDSSSDTYKNAIKPVFQALQELTNDSQFVEMSENGWLDSSEYEMTTNRVEDGLFIRVQNLYNSENLFYGVRVFLGYDETKVAE